VTFPDQQRASVGADKHGSSDPQHRRIDLWRHQRFSKQKRAKAGEPALKSSRFR
jgi:hypothetical protein